MNTILITGIIHLDSQLSKKETMILYLSLFIFAFQACNIKDEKKEENIVVSTITNPCYSIYDTIIHKEVYLIVPDMPFFSNEKNGELEYIFNNFKYPTGESQFTFQLQFVIDTDGRLVGERIMDKSQLELSKSEKELLNTVKLMPLWHPGKCNGETVPVLITLPLRIKPR